MPFLTDRSTFEYFTAACRKSDARVALSVEVDGTRFDLFGLDHVSFYFVARVEDDPSLEVYGALDRALEVLGIDGTVFPLVISAEDREAIFAGDVQGESCGYAVFARKLGHDRRVSSKSSGGIEGLDQAGDDVGFCSQLVPVAADEQSGVRHESSPGLGGGDSVRDDRPQTGWAKLIVRPPVRRYQQVPRQVDAVQWTGSNFGDLMVFVAGVNVARRGDRFCIEPLDEPSIFAVPGDYIVRDAAGKYQCIPAVEFQSTHAVVVSL
ncbi:hypothetical protein NY08_500 [Rhodococcus sp. B7740]|uniref:hypothetical protein n=1 Tax=Rhodococcus sp. B7740 TaxID=1564114 RepID=UPI0005D9FD2D|nr:hypothetical protein [Rhodococcus sp. B7740]AJW38532.1 hypothetical protein NY08_500 [Rhodococcus sp. B7740]